MTRRRGEEGDQCDDMHTDVKSVTENVKPAENGAKDIRRGRNGSKTHNSPIELKIEQPESAIPWRCRRKRTGERAS